MIKNRANALMKKYLPKKVKALSSKQIETIIRAL
jgi:hypothetical protein